MKRKLIKEQQELYHYVDGKRIEGPNKNMSGDCSWLYGNCSRLNGDCSWLYGDCSRLVGDLDECEITEEDRSRGIKISQLINVK